MTFKFSCTILAFSTTITFMHMYPLKNFNVALVGVVTDIKISMFMVKNSLNIFYHIYVRVGSVINIIIKKP